MPLDLTETAQGFFESDPAEPEAPGPVHFDVDEILTRGCQPTRATLKPVDAERLPGLMSGSVTDYSIDDCTLERAQGFAGVLNNLALENGSSVTHDGQSFESIESIEAVVQALLAAGHRIVITNDRFFADFLGLYFNGAAVVAPLWLDTGIPLADGSGATLEIPSPHTHHTIRVSGPLVNTTLMYNMGVSAGVSFRAVGSVRSPWTGLRTRYTYDSAEDADAVVRLMTLGGQLRKKWVAAAAGLPAEGYGSLGVCTDSTAVLEYSEEQSVSIFPLAHSEDQYDDGDPVDAILQKLPKDAAGYDHAEALERALATLPLDTLSALPFPELSARLEALSASSVQ